jgi:ribosomal protein L7/L12
MHQVTLKKQFPKMKLKAFKKSLEEAGAEVELK